MKTYKITKGNKQYVIKAKDTYSAVAKLHTALKDQKQVAKFTKFNNGDVAEGFIMETSKGYTFTSPQNPKDDKDFSTQKLAEIHANKLGYVKDNKSIKDSDKENEQERNKKIQQLANKTGLSFPDAKRMLEEIESGDDSYYEKMSEMLRDDRLSPMTYKKLKEMGYNSDKWQNLTQEEANKIVAKSETSAKPKTEAPKQETKPKSKTEFTNNLWNKIDKNIAESGSNIVKASDGSEYTFDITDNSSYSKAYKAALSGMPVSINGREAKIENITPDQYLAACAKQKGQTVERLTKDRIDESYFKLIKKLGKSKTINNSIWLDQSSNQQEGIHRAMALKKLGVKTIPTLVVSKKKVSEENKDKYLSF